MKNRIIFSLMITGFLFACKDQPKEDKTSEQKDSIAVKQAESISTNVSLLNDYRSLEQLFANDNWLMPGKKDSSYFYFSRLGNYQVNTYEYKLVKGDSAEVKHGSIQAEGNKLTMNFNGQKLYLTSATLARATWTVAGSDSSSYEFLKLNDQQLRLTFPDKRTIVMKKLFPFSTFLIKSRYDYANGTRLAFDNTELGKKK